MTSEEKDKQCRKCERYDCQTCLMNLTGVDLVIAVFNGYDQDQIDRFRDNGYEFGWRGGPYA